MSTVHIRPKKSLDVFVTQVSIYCVQTRGCEYWGQPVARHKGLSFDEGGILEAIRTEIDENPVQSTSSISEKVYRKTGTKPSPSYVGAIMSQTESYWKHIAERAVQLGREIERLDELSLKLQRKGDLLQEEARNAKSGDEKRADDLFNSALSLFLGPLQETNDRLRTCNQRLERLNRQIEGWGERPVVRKLPLSVIYDAQKWVRMLEDCT